MKLFFYQTGIGKIGIAEHDSSITNVYFEKDVVVQDVEIQETYVIKEALQQLNAYIAGKLKEFSLPLAPFGTNFMRHVWEEVCNVPYGKTASYKDIAAAVGNIKAVRAVGMANNRNPIPIFIPCHKIIGTSGKLVGYRGGLTMKQKLLELEKQNGII